MPPKGSKKAVEPAAPKPQKEKKTAADFVKEEKIKLQPYFDAEKERDVGYNKASFATDESEWAHTLAAHLAAEPAFADWMKSPQTLEAIQLTTEWMGTVHLAGRATKYSDIKDWRNKWFKTEQKMQILQQAKDIYEQAADNTGPSAMKGEEMKLPDNTSKDKAKRDDLFKVLSTRSKLTQFVKSCTDTEFALVTSTKAFAGHVIASQVSREMLDATEELQELEGAKQECRALLAKSALNKAGVDMLDDLLKSVPASNENGLLYTIPDAGKFELREPSLNQEQADPAEESEAIAEDGSTIVPSPFNAATGQCDGITIDFNLDRQLGDDKIKVFTLRTPTIKAAEREMLESTNVIDGSAILENTMLVEHDQECAEDHHCLAPFFHYYAHLWHPACRPFRGKQELIDDIGLVDDRLSQSQSSMGGMQEDEEDW